MNTSQIDCSKADASFRDFCTQIGKRITEYEDKLDDQQTQIYIISGVLGGVSLILIIILIALAIQLSGLRQKAIYLAGSPNTKPKPTPERGVGGTAPRNGNTGGGGRAGDTSHLRQPPQHSYAQPPQNLTSEEELAHLGFAAYTGHPVDTNHRGISTSPAVNSAGGVRVLPRNPPTGFRNNAAFNEGF